MARHLAQSKTQLQHTLEESPGKGTTHNRATSTHKQVLFGLKPQGGKKPSDLGAEVQNSTWECSLVHRTKVQQGYETIQSAQK